MKSIGLLSDTHSSMHPKVFEFFKDCDEIWHAGDIGNMDTLKQLVEFKPVVAVYGNVDDYKIRVKVPEFQYFISEEVKVMMTHIGGYPGHYPQHIKELINKNKPDLFICGHSHILRIIFDKKFNMMTINPGAAGSYGFHKSITFIRFKIDGKLFKDMEIMDIPR